MTSIDNEVPSNFFDKSYSWSVGYQELENTRWFSILVFLLKNNMLFWNIVSCCKCFITTVKVQHWYFASVEYLESPSPTESSCSEWVSGTGCSLQSYVTSFVLGLQPVYDREPGRKFHILRQKKYYCSRLTFIFLNILGNVVPGASRAGRQCRWGDCTISVSDKCVSPQNPRLCLTHLEFPTWLSHRVSRMFANTV